MEPAEQIDICECLDFPMSTLFPGFLEFTVMDGVMELIYLIQSIHPLDFTRIELKRMCDMPQGGDELLCPIGMEPFDKCTLASKPDACFLDRTRAAYCVARLPCGHYFGIMSIISHFETHNMKCPLCRSGPSGKLYCPCLPMHLQTPVTRCMSTASSEYVPRISGRWTRLCRWITRRRLPANQITPYPT